MKRRYPVTSKLDRTHKKFAHPLPAPSSDLCLGCFFSVEPDDGCRWKVVVPCPRSTFPGRIRSIFEELSVAYLEELVLIEVGRRNEGLVCERLATLSLSLHRLERFAPAVSHGIRRVRWRFAGLAVNRLD